MVRGRLLATSCGLASLASLALACATAHVGPRPAPAVPSPWALVYVIGADGVLEQRDDATPGWTAVCGGRCGEYLPASGTYRMRGAAATSDPFSLPPPDLGRVVVRFDDDGHVWTHVTPRGLRQPLPFVPSLVMFLH